MASELEALRLRLANDQGGELSLTRARLTRLARAFGLPSELIEDAVQESLIEAWTHLERLTAPEGFVYWIDEVCRNVCRRLLRRHARELSHRQALSAERVDTDDERDQDYIAQAPDLASNADPALALLESASRADEEALLERALGLLPVETRRLVELVSLEELPHAEVAAQLGVSVGALDTRLSRARRRLYDVMNGPLRSEALALGLALDETRGEGWSETHLWCSRCGVSRLQGVFMWPEGRTERGPNLHLRCPSCARQFGHDTIHTMGLVALDGAKAFRPAWKRAMQGLTERVMAALQVGIHTCPYCDAPAVIAVNSQSADSAYPFAVKVRCARCGKIADTTGDFPAIDQLAAWSHPVTRRFLLDRPRWTSGFSAPVEHDGIQVIPITIKDSTSSEQMTLLADRSTLRPIAVV
jgi:RNA polymerase sigma-70 factor (ECF subfamily)